MEKEKSTAMTKKQFWLKLILYLVVGGVLPFLFLTWRFKLFGKISKLSIGGWGLIAIIFIGLFLIKTIKQIRKGLPYSLFSQCLEGACRTIIPLVVAAVICYYLSDMMTQIFQFLCVAILCESIAVIINPIPRWEHENKLEEQQNSLKKMLTTLGIGNNEK